MCGFTFLVALSGSVDGDDVSGWVSSGRVSRMMEGGENSTDESPIRLLLCTSFNITSLRLQMTLQLTPFTLTPHIVASHGKIYQVTKGPLRKQGNQLEIQRQWRSDELFQIFKLHDATVERFEISQCKKDGLSKWMLVN